MLAQWVSYTAFVLITLFSLLLDTIKIPDKLNPSRTMTAKFCNALKDISKPAKAPVLVERMVHISPLPSLLCQSLGPVVL